MAGAPDMGDSPCRAISTLAPKITTLVQTIGQTAPVQGARHRTLRRLSMKRFFTVRFEDLQFASFALAFMLTSVQILVV
jgi:hypothetical protein